MSQKVADKSVAVVIPARYASTRFPGKPLATIAGMTMIERVYKQSSLAKNVGTVLVATDDARIRDEVIRFGGQYVMTRDDHPTGTDRLAEVAALRPDIDIIINVQGDEPMIDPKAIETVVEPLLADANVEMATIAFRIPEPADAELETLVKVVCDLSGFAMYFSRLPIPFYRNRDELESVVHYGHTGIYAYTRQCLQRLASLPPTRLEQAEMLEQLRALENGIKIKVTRFDKRSQAVDVPEDIAKVEKALTLSRV